MTLGRAAAGEQEASSTMVGWAFRYLGMVVAVGLVFASFQHGDWSAWLARYARDDQGSVAAARSRPSAPRHDGYDADVEHVIEAGPHGHYVIEAMVNGRPVTFLVDTGATEIVLTLDDARRLGFEPRTLRYTQRFRTANGEVRGAPVRLREIRIGQLQLYDLQASVNEAPLGISLLGMSFLERLAGYEVRDGRLVLRW